MGKHIQPLLIVIFTTMMVLCESCAINKAAPVVSGHELTQTETQATTNPIDTKTIWDSVEVKANWFMNGIEPNRELNLIPPVFNEFYTKFITDSLFQKQHIAFEQFVGVIGQCDTTIRLNNANWIFTDWNFTEFFKNDNNTENIDGWDNTFFYSSSKFYYQFRLKEVGWIYKTGFEKIGDNWQLTLYYVNAC